MNPTLVDGTKQEARTFLRERFLRFLAALNGQDADINMYEKTNVTGILRAVDINVQSAQISELQTPIGIIPESVLRTGDIRTITIPDFKT